MKTYEKKEKKEQNYFIKEYLMKVFCPKLDIFPKILKTQTATPTRRVFHTVFGFGLYLFLLLVPCSAYYATNTQRNFSVLFMDVNYTCSLVRNILTIYVFISQIVESVILKSSENVDLTQKERENYLLGFRNLMILTSVMIGKVYQLHVVLLPSKSWIFLGRNRLIQKGAFLFLYYIQSLIVAYLTILVDEYLTEFGLMKQNKLVLYQVGELLISILYADRLINYSYSLIIFGTFIIFLIKILTDRICQTSFSIEHKLIKGASKKQVLKCSSILLSASFAINLIRRAVFNLVTLIIEPLFRLLNFSSDKIFQYGLKKNSKIILFFLKGPLDLSVNPMLFTYCLFNDQALSWTILPYMPTWRCATATYLFLCFIIENMILTPFFIWNIDYFSPELRPSNIANQIHKSNSKLANVMPTKQAITIELKKKIDLLKIKCILAQVFMSPFIDLMPIYGLRVTGAVIENLYNLITNLISAFKDLTKSEINELPKPLKIVAENAR